MQRRRLTRFLFMAIAMLGVIAGPIPAIAQQTEAGEISDDLGLGFELVESKVVPPSGPGGPTGWLKQFASDEAFVTISAFQLDDEEEAVVYMAGVMNGFQEGTLNPARTVHKSKENVVQVAGTIDGIDVIAAFYAQGDVGFAVASAGTPQPALDIALDAQLAHSGGELARFRVDEPEIIESQSSAYRSGQLTGRILFWLLLIGGFVAFLRWAGNRNKDGGKEIFFENEPPAPPPSGLQ